MFKLFFLAVALFVAVTAEPEAKPQLSAISPYNALYGRQYGAFDAYKYNPYTMNAAKSLYGAYPYSAGAYPYHSGYPHNHGMYGMYNTWGQNYPYNTWGQNYQSYPYNTWGQNYPYSGMYNSPLIGKYF